MADQVLKNLSGQSRRDFIKWSAVVAAALGIERSRYLDVMFDKAGAALAEDAQCAKAARHVHMLAGNGGLAWFTQLFPIVSVARAGNPQFSFLGAPNQITDAPTDYPSVHGPFSPAKTLAKKYQWSMIVEGTNQTHTAQPNSGLALGGNGLLAACAAMQRAANPTLIPVMAVNPLQFGTANGAPAPATVANANGLVDLFNSAASRTLLQDPRNAALSEAYYKAFLSLNAAASRQTAMKTYGTGKVAINLLGRNLADQLRATAADDTRYGIGQGTPTNVQEIGRALIVAIKAFKLGLTGMLMIPAMRDDPHGAYNNIGGSTNIATMLGRIIDGFMNDALNTPDPSCSGRNLLDNLVISITGDTYKAPFNRAGWGDGTPANSNIMYVMGAGYLKTGWLGALTPGATQVMDPATGQLVAANGQSLGNAAAAGARAVAYAVAKGDAQNVSSSFGVSSPTNDKAYVNPVLL
jgi:hypothetical protein